MRKPMTDYHWTSGRKYRSRSCKECWTVRARSRREVNRESIREVSFLYNLRVKYGLTGECYNQILDMQGGVCGICGCGLDKSAHVDHDHSTGAVRGILCFRCNTALGKFRDDVVVLQAAIDYLLRPNPEVPGRPRELTPEERRFNRSSARLKAAESWKPVARDGERNPAAKLTDVEAAEIRARYAAGDVTQASLAREYGCSQAAVSRIVLGKVRRMQSREDLEAA